jgi:bifunctional DNA-binding transcriptional regulator/antitoxin component of YhaV-PrlF toxin-antitoxin module
MKRKVIKQGHNTLTITLPRKWTEKQGIKAGDEIELEENDHHLKISSGFKQIKVPLNLDLKKVSIANSRVYISNAYKLGFDEIHVVFNNFSDFINIQKKVDRLLGFEIISNTKNSCKIKVISLINKEEFFNIFKKSYQLNLVTFELLKNDMLKCEYLHFDVIEQYHLKVISFTDYCRRLINKYTIYDGKSDKSIYVLLLKINYINTVMRDIYKYLADKKCKLDKNIYKFFIKSEEMYRSVFEGYFKENLSDIDYGINLKKRLYDEEGSRLLEKSKGVNSVIICKILELIKYIYSSTGPMITIIYGKNSFNFKTLSFLEIVE